ncbi:MAG: anti-sigma factor antagonist, partial [Phototrophicales bacterium]
EQALEEELQQGHFRLLISFAHVTYISSSGLKVLVTAWRKARDNKGDVILAALQPRILEVFEMIGFDMMFNIYDSPEAALADMHYE